jgi:hypothetical protein
MKVYLANGFSPSMLPLRIHYPIYVKFEEISQQEFCGEIKEALENNSLVNSIGHQSTVSLINSLCGTNLTVNRIAFVTDDEDRILIINIAVRLEEGKVLNDDEIKQLLSQGKIKFIEAQTGVSSLR